MPAISKRLWIQPGDLRHGSTKHHRCFRHHQQPLTRIEKGNPCLILKPILNTNQRGVREHRWATVHHLLLAIAHVSPPPKRTREPTSNLAVLKPQCQHREKRPACHDVTESITKAKNAMRNFRSLSSAIDGHALLSIFGRRSRRPKVSWTTLQSVVFPSRAERR